MVLSSDKWRLITIKLIKFYQRISNRKRKTFVKWCQIRKQNRKQGTVTWGSFVPRELPLCQHAPPFPHSSTWPWHLEWATEVSPTSSRWAEALRDEPQNWAGSSNRSQDASQDLRGPGHHPLRFLLCCWAIWVLALGFLPLRSSYLKS